MLLEGACQVQTISLRDPRPMLYSVAFQDPKAPEP